MGKTRKVNKRFSFANNLILENDLSLLSGRLYTDINGIVFILGLGLFISLVNCIVILTPALSFSLAVTAGVPVRHNGKALRHNPPTTLSVP